MLSVVITTLPPNVTGAVIVTSPATVISLSIVSAELEIVNPVRFVPPPTIPERPIVPVPDVRERVVDPSTVPEKSILPPVDPVVKVTPLVATETLSEKVIVPPEAEAPPPSAAPAIAVIVVSFKTIVSPLVSK